MGAGSSAAGLRLQPVSGWAGGSAGSSHGQCLLEIELLFHSVAVRFCCNHPSFEFHTS